MNVRMSSGRDEVANWLAQRGASMQEEIAELVAINSYTENVEGGRQVGRVLAQKTFAIEGLTHNAVASARFADHLVFASNGGAGRDPSDTSTPSFRRARSKGFGETETSRVVLECST
jgi:hypothetical protein